MILSCHNLNKSFGENIIIKNASFHIEDNEKVAVVGINGAGKTTLIKMIIGELLPDEGLVTFSKDKSFGYLSQHQDLASSSSIYEELLSSKADIIALEELIRKTELLMKSASDEDLPQIMNSYSVMTHDFELKNGYAYRSEVVGILKGLGFLEEEFSKQVATLSGGQKTRVALGKLLLTKPDLILLDEPTNHLDINAISWLEAFLSNYKGAVIVVSHDRYFLDRIAGKIIEIDNTSVLSFPGNYSAYANQKELLRISRINAYVNQQREIKHQEEVIARLKSYNREKSVKRAESREKLLNKMQVLDKPLEVNNEMHIQIEPNCLSGNDVLSIVQLSKAFGNNKLFENVSLEIKRGEHVALIGENGTGKTTLLKMINGIVESDHGSIKLGTNVNIGYYDQEHHVLHMDKTLFEEISDSYPSLTNTEIRNTLAAFLFTGDDVYKRIKDISGGERGRVSLAKLMLSEANFLILDEPTNHLDIMSKEILENAINHYSGTVLFVSHDRYFVNKTAHRILDLTSLGLNNYAGNYDYYIEKKDLIYITTTPNNTDNGVSPTTETSIQKNDWMQQKELQAKKRKLENDLQKTESQIANLETRNSEIEELMYLPEICTDVRKLQELAKESEDNQIELSSLYESWEKLCEENESTTLLP